MASLTFVVHYGAPFSATCGRPLAKQGRSCFCPGCVPELRSIVLVPHGHICPGYWPSARLNVPDTLVFDQSEQLSPRGMFAGHVLWVLECGFPKQLRLIHCLQLDPLVGDYAGALARRSAFLVALNMLCLLCHAAHHHYRVAMLPLSQGKS